MYKFTNPIAIKHASGFDSNGVECDMGTLYVIATPIGNLLDISRRALNVFAEVDLVLAEDTRTTKKLLAKFEIEKNVDSYHQRSKDKKKFQILKALLDGRDIALVTDAGTPGISDPGNELVQFLVQNSKDINIIPIPGPSAASTALSVCGFDVSKHIFLGFWPKKKVSKNLKLVASSKLPFIYFDSPRRVIKNLDKISEALGQGKRAFVGRELTKIHETHYRGTLKEVIGKLKTEKFMKGEIVVVVE